MLKRKKITKTANVVENRKIEEWESNYYESLKNSSESEFEEQMETASNKSEQAKRRKSKKQLKLNFKKKVLKSEKKSNLIKLNINLKQLIYDDLGTNKNKTRFNSYLNCSATEAKENWVSVCSVCFRRLAVCRCRFCLLSYCLDCNEIHPEANCEAYAKY